MADALRMGLPASALTLDVRAEAPDWLRAAVADLRIRRLVALEARAQSAKRKVAKPKAERAPRERKAPGTVRAARKRVAKQTPAQLLAELQGLGLDATPEQLAKLAPTRRKRVPKAPQPAPTPPQENASTCETDSTR